MNARGAAAILTAWAAFAGWGLADGAPAADPPGRPAAVGWRYDGSGVFPDADPVIEWDEAAGRNVRWKVPLPAWSNASPVVAAGRVVVLAEPTGVLCFDAATGEQLWRQDRDHLHLTPAAGREAEVRAAWAEMLVGWNRVTKAYDRENYKPGKPFGAYGLWPGTYDNALGNTSATPLCDGERVWVSFGTNTVACYRLADGEILWATWLGTAPTKADVARLKPLFGDGHLQYRWPDTRFVPSPRLAGGKLIVQSGFALRGLDPDTGAVHWERDYVPANYGPGTPAVVRLAGADGAAEEVLVTARGWAVRAADGAVLSRGVGADMNAAGASPLAAGDLAVFADTSTGGARTTGDLVAVRLRLDGGGLNSEVVWRTRARGLAEGSAVIRDGLLFAPRQTYDLATGEAVGRPVRMPLDEPSLALAAGRLYAFGEDGGCVVTTADPARRVLAENALDLAAAVPDAGGAPPPLAAPGPGEIGSDRLWSSPFPAGGAIFVRGRKALYCLAPPGAAR